MGDRLVLGYHAVSPTWPASLSIEPERLEAQLATLADLGYRGATFTETVSGRSKGRTVAITFDDGLRSVITRALPILASYDFVGTAFVVTDHVGSERPVDWPNINRWIEGPHEEELWPLSWQELGRLIDAGWEIGSHTVSHPHLPTLTDESLSAELSASRRACQEHLGIECTSIAYPYGEVDGRVARATRRCGYVAGAALPARIHRADRLRWPRVGVWRTDPDHLFEVKLSRSTRRRLDFRHGTIHRLPRWRFGEP